MKKCLLNVLILLAFSPFCAIAEALEDYKIDPMHSYILWHISHFDFSNQAGKWYVEGDIKFDPKNIQDSKVNAKIDVTKMVTGIEKLDNHLKSHEFFDVAKFPTATFVSEKIESPDNKTMKIYGTLTVHGISKPIVLDATFKKMGVNPASNKETIGFEAETKLKRSDFGITSFLPGLGDEVKLDLAVEANKSK